MDDGKMEEKERWNAFATICLLWRLQKAGGRAFQSILEDFGSRQVIINEKKAKKQNFRKKNENEKRGGLEEVEKEGEGIVGIVEIVGRNCGRRSLIVLIKKKLKKKFKIIKKR